MHGTFNGVRLAKITSLKYQHLTPGLDLVSFRVMESPLPKLEQILQLKAPAHLILADKEIEGKIVAYSANVQSGYEITIEALRKDSSR
jgi:hypothetical protein